MDLAPFACAAILIGTVLALATMQVDKYFRDLTTYTERKERSAHLPFPPVSLCPGFKIEHPGSTVWTRQVLLESLTQKETAAVDHIWDMAEFPATAESLRSLWEETTFGHEEVINSVYLYGQLEGDDASYHPRKGANNSECIDIKEHSTLSGRCYTVDFPCSGVAAIRQMSMTFNLSRVAAEGGSLSFYVHDLAEDALLGLNSNYWARPTAWARVLVNQGQIL